MRTEAGGKSDPRVHARQSGWRRGLRAAAPDAGRGAERWRGSGGARKTTSRGRRRSTSPKACGSSATRARRSCTAPRSTGRAASARAAATRSASPPVTASPCSWTARRGATSASRPATRWSSATPRYTDRLKAARKATGLEEAVLTGTARIGGSPVVWACSSSRSSAAAWPPSSARSSRARSSSRPRSGCRSSSWPPRGARMQEGILRLMQMAKTSAALARLAEEGALIRCSPIPPPAASPRASRCSATSCSRSRARDRCGPARHRRDHPPAAARGLPAPEFLLQHGQLDLVVERRELRETPGASSGSSPRLRSRRAHDLRGGRGSPPRAPRRRAGGSPSRARAHRGPPRGARQPRARIPDRPGRRHNGRARSRRCSPPSAPPPGCARGSTPRRTSGPSASASAWTAGPSRPPTWWTASRPSARWSRALDASMFEAATALALDHFAREGRDVLEVGLGGRLDATTVGPRGGGAGPDRLRPPAMPRLDPRGHRGREGRHHPERCRASVASGRRPRRSARRATAAGVPLLFEGRELHGAARSHRSPRRSWIEGPTGAWPARVRAPGRIRRPTPCWPRRRRTLGPASRRCAASRRALARALPDRAAAHRSEPALVLTSPQPRRRARSPRRSPRTSPGSPSRSWSRSTRTRIAPASSRPSPRSPPASSTALRARAPPRRRSWPRSPRTRPSSPRRAGRAVRRVRARDGDAARAHAGGACRLAPSDGRGARGARPNAGDSLPDRRERCCMVPGSHGIPEAA